MAANPYPGGAAPNPPMGPLANPPAGTAAPTPAPAGAAGTAPTAIPMRALSLTAPAAASLATKGNTWMNKHGGYSGLVAAADAISLPEAQAIHNMDREALHAQLDAILKGRDELRLEVLKKIQRNLGIAKDVWLSEDETGQRRAQNIRRALKKLTDRTTNVLLEYLERRLRKAEARPSIDADQEARLEEAQADLQEALDREDAAAQEYQQLIFQKNEQIQRLHDELQASHAETAQAKSMLATTNDKHDKQIADMKENHAAYVQDIEKSKATAVDELRDAHAKELENHKQSREKLEENYKNEIAKIKESIAVNVSAQETAAKEILSALKNNAESCQKIVQENKDVESKVMDKYNEQAEAVKKVIEGNAGTQKTMEQTITSALNANATACQKIVRESADAHANAQAKLAAEFRESQQKMAEKVIAAQEGRIEGLSQDKNNLQSRLDAMTTERDTANQSLDNRLIAAHDEVDRLDQLHDDSLRALYAQEIEARRFRTKRDERTTLYEEALNQVDELNKVVDELNKVVETLLQEP